MKIILKIAWRNIWRNPRRTWVLISSITVGMLGYLGTTAFSRGFLNQMIESTINLQGGHIMIYGNGYFENPQLKNYIQSPQKIEDKLSKIDDIEIAPLVSFKGMISSSETAAGVIIQGVVPERESRISIMSKSVIAGEYLSENSTKNQILIGKALAKKLKVDMGEKIVLMISDLNNEISSGAYRIIGLFETSSTDFDKAYVFISTQKAQGLAGFKEHLTGLTIRLAQPETLDDKMAKIKSAFPDEKLEVLSWKDRNPLLVMSTQAFDSSIVIVVVILFLAIAFSIANSFIMVIYERIHEFGIMMANGVLPKKIRTMLYAEALFITIIGLGFGFILSAIIIGAISHVGLDLSLFAKGLGKFGVGNIIYPKVAPKDLLVGIPVIFVIVFLSVLYPSIKASRFEVADAIRFV